MYKVLNYHCKDSENSRVLLLGITEIWAVNIDGSTNHSDLRIKSGTRLLCLHDTSKTDYQMRSF